MQLSHKVYHVIGKNMDRSSENDQLAGLLVTLCISTRMSERKHKKTKQTPEALLASQALKLWIRSELFAEPRNN